uniref:Uncharacterized protein n=1 Tax=Periophthalmus magnuspinnatus TaxID=409849 RepID=A0A3B3ZM56_9GOBI
MATDRTAYIVRTSSCSGDYFVNTAGVALVVQQPSIYAGGPDSSGATVQAQLQQVFEQDEGTEGRPTAPLYFMAPALWKCVQPGSLGPLLEAWELGTSTRGLGA